MGFILLRGAWSVRGETVSNGSAHETGCHCERGAAPSIVFCALIQAGTAAQQPPIPISPLSTMFRVVSAASSCGTEGCRWPLKAFAFEGIWTGSQEGVREFLQTLGIRFVVFSCVSY